MRIVDADGKPLPAGAVGEITCRPRYPHVMSEGYIGAGSQVEPHPEWFRTGDLGRLDADQNLTYVDRIKDSLRRRGENVSSVEVEAVVHAPSRRGRSRRGRGAQRVWVRTTSC